MMIRKKLAWLYLKYFKKFTSISPVPDNFIFYFICYGTLCKYYNYLICIRDYNNHRLVVRNYPLEISVDVNNICNLCCPLCPTGAQKVDRAKGSMSIDTFKEILEKFSRYAFRMHFSLWGEPLLHKELPQMVSLTEKSGMGTEISTNLSINLSDIYISKLIKAGLSWLIVSIDGASAESYSKYRVNGNYSLVLSNLRRFVQLKKEIGYVTPFIEWQYIPFRHNEHEIETVVQEAKDVGVDYLRLKPPRCTYNEGPNELPDNWLPSLASLQYMIPNNRNYLHDMHCPFLWRWVNINWDSSISPCCETYEIKDDLANLHDKDFSLIWNGASFIKSRRLALGGGANDEKTSMACYHCKVFKKPYDLNNNRLVQNR